MPSLSVQIDREALTRLNSRLTELLNRSINLEPVMRQAAEYMKNSTVNRVARTKTSPSGERWAALSEITVRIKGHDQPLFQSGSMMHGIRVGYASSDGFMIASDAPHSSWMQRGVKRGGKRRKQRIPARPFMGFSEENVRRISKMVREYIARGVAE